LPDDVAVDSAGTLYIADSSANRIRRVAPDGTISTLAGGNTFGFSGDGGPASQALLNRPVAIAVDSKDNVYIADNSNYRIRRIDTAGVITTVAGTGEKGLSGDGGPAVAAQISTVGDITIDAADNIYIAGFSNTLVRRITPDGTIDTVASSISNVPSAVLEPNGGILMGNGNNPSIAVARPGGDPKFFAGSRRGYGGDGGTASRASFRTTGKMTRAPDGRIFVCDTDNHRVRVLTPLPLLTTGGAVNAASFAKGAVAADSIFSAFGWNLASETAFASSTPLPPELGGARMSLRDSAGTTLPVGNFFASITQRNLYLPAQAAAGPATLTVRDRQGREASVAIQIARVGPGLFTMNSSGGGVVAATALRVSAGDARSNVAIAQLSNGAWVPLPINLGPESDQIFLTIFCTGLRGRSDLSNVKATIGGVPIPVQYAGEQGSFVGLDQLNLGPIPRSLIGAGEVTISVTVDGVAANPVTIAIQ